MKEKNKEIATFKIAQELGGLELLDAKYEKQNFSRHSHEGYTIGVIEKGAQQFFRTGGNHIAPQNSIILVNADEVHNGHSATEGGWEYKAMYPVPEQFQTLGQELGSPNIALPYFPQPVVYDPELASQLRLVFETLEKSDNRLLRETLVYGTLIKLASKHSTHRAPLKESTKAQRQLQLVKEFLEDFPQTDVSLEELAKLAGLSPFTYCANFKSNLAFHLMLTRSSNVYVWRKNCSNKGRESLMSHKNVVFMIKATCIDTLRKPWASRRANIFALAKSAISYKAICLYHVTLIA
ncbi:AraC family transcriptional regulator [Vibrio parahaemolyticus]|nr:AraC family transcriptional regulator [Vibrio parahaemolyticus]